MKNIMENYNSEQGGEHLGQATIEPLMLSIVRLHATTLATTLALSVCHISKQLTYAYVVSRYVRYVNNDPEDIKIKTKLCNLVQVMMSRRDDLTFRQEMKFRNKLVEYLTGLSSVMSASQSVDISLM